MAKTTAPLLSLSASGTLADTLTYSRWRGVRYVRQRVIPANPNTTAQAATRNVFTMLSTFFKFMGTLAVAPWTAFATGRPFLDRNAFMGQNTEALRSDADMTDLIGSPGAGGGPPPDSIAAAAGVGTITVTFVNPTPPTGWSILAAVAIAVPDQDPAIAFVGPVTEAEDAVTPFDTVVLSGLDTVLHQVRGWIRWQKPDLSIAYSVSLADTATPT